MAIQTDAEQATIQVGKLFIGDIRVPHIEGKKAFDGGYELTITKGVSVKLPDEETFQGVATFVANAMAVAAGFTHFGATSEVRNEYAPPSKSQR